MTFVEVLEETTVLVSVSKNYKVLQSRFKDIAKSAITLQYTSFVLKEKGIFNLFRNIQKLLK